MSDNIDKIINVSERAELIAAQLYFGNASEWERAVSAIELGLREAVAEAEQTTRVALMMCDKYRAALLERGIDEPA